MLRSKLIKYLELNENIRVKELFDICFINIKKINDTFILSILDISPKMVDEYEEFPSPTIAIISEDDKILLKNFVSECFNVDSDKVVVG